MDPPSTITYLSVVSRESILIGFLVATLNGLNVLAADIQNAYLNAPTEEKVRFRAGPEWGVHAGKPVLIVRQGAVQVEEFWTSMEITFCLNLRTDWIQVQFGGSRCLVQTFGESYQ